MVREFPFKVSWNSATPWMENLFKIEENSKKLGDERRQTFQTFELKGMPTSRYTTNNGLSQYKSEKIKQKCFGKIGAHDKLPSRSLNQGIEA